MALKWPEFILNFFGSDLGMARKRYRRFVEGEAGRVSPSPFEKLTA
jgi:hypothetical protein